MATGFFNKLPEVAEAFGQIAQQIVEDTAFSVQEKAEQNCPVDTGFLRDTIYTKTFASSNYRGGGRVTKSAKQSGQYTLPEVQQPPNQYTAYVAVGASYGVFVEFGTSRAPAQPFFFPAIEASSDAFEQAAGDLEAQIKQKAGIN